MKNIIYTIIFACIALLTACKDQDVMFREYVVEGGVTYLGSVSSLDARIGYNRLEISFDVVDPLTTKVGIYWNDYQDSIMLDVGEEKTMRKIIDLHEGSYSLFVKSFDKKGNFSNPIELITRTVGPNYVTALAHRGMKTKTSKINNDLFIEWYNADAVNGAGFTDLVYINTNDEETKVRVENTTSLTVISDYKQGTKFKRITYYSPDDKWLDSIVAPIEVETSLVIDKKTGRVVNYSTQNGVNVASNFYNGDPADMWLTNGSYPEYATIDLGHEIPVSGFDIWPSYRLTAGRADPRAPTRIKFESSIDNIEWTTLGEFDYDNGLSYYKREFKVPVTQARYVRFTGVECAYSPVYGPGIGGPGTNQMNLAEIDVLFELQD